MNMLLPLDAVHDGRRMLLVKVRASRVAEPWRVDDLEAEITYRDLVDRRSIGLADCIVLDIVLELKVEKVCHLVFECFIAVLHHGGKICEQVQKGRLPGAGWANQYDRRLFRSLPLESCLDDD